jgi:hypothetical protein
MKKIALMTFCAMAAVLFASCGSSTKDYRVFIGTWGVERIEYYNIDYAGNPIAGSMVTWDITPGDPDFGIDLVFRADKTGELRDRSKDTIWTDWNSETQDYETMIVAPDTTIVSPFEYSYDQSESTLYMDVDYVIDGVLVQKLFKMKISNMTAKSFIYENEYENNYVERSYLKRLSDTPSKGIRRSMNQKRPYMPGSFLSGK